MARGAALERAQLFAACPLQPPFARELQEMVVPELATLVCWMQPLTLLFRGLARWVKRQLWAQAREQVRR